MSAGGTGEGGLVQLAPPALFALTPQSGFSLIPPMNPLTLILPALVAVSGVVAFVILPLDLPIRLAVLGTDLVAAVFLAVVLARRNSSK